MKAIEELAREWAEKQGTVELDEYGNNLHAKKYIEIATETLTSLLEELPEINDPKYRNDFTDGEKMYKAQVLSLIQNKIK
jgi:hypothetical protein